MGKLIKYIKIGLLCSGGAIAMSACAPKYYGTADGVTYKAQNSHAAYGSYQSNYGRYGAQQTSYSQNAAAGTLRPPCSTQHTHQPCGYMRVVPVYPIYQVAMPQSVPSVEVPVVEAPAPAPVYIESVPQDTYIPVADPLPFETTVETGWPEPAAPVTDWKPLRK